MKQHIGQPVDYNVEKLRELREEEKQEQDEDSPEPNYACATCGEETHISEHKRRAPAWCNDCGKVKSHGRLPQKS